MSRTERQFPRYAHAAEVTVRPAGAAAARGRSSNVSRGGLCAVVPTPVTVGSPVDVELTLVFGEDSYSEPLSLPARVVWCTDLGDQWQLGISFRGLGADGVRYLDLFLRYLDEGQHSRRAATERDEEPGDPDPFAG